MSWHAGGGEPGGDRFELLQTIADPVTRSRPVFKDKLDPVIGDAREELNDRRHHIGDPCLDAGAAMRADMDVEFEGPIRRRDCQLPGEQLEALAMDHRIR